MKVALNFDPRKEFTFFPVLLLLQRILPIITAHTQPRSVLGAGLSSVSTSGTPQSEHCVAPARIRILQLGQIN